MDPRSPRRPASSLRPPSGDPRAPVERLPVELIHKIFLQSLEFNFPRASLHLAAALSNPVIYTWLIRLGFSSNNASSRTDIFVHPFLPLPLDYFALDARQRSALQTEILRCRWCTIGLMRKCQRDYIEYVLRQKCAHLILAPADRAQLNNLDEFWRNMPQYNDAPLGRRGRGDLILAARHPNPTPSPDSSTSSTLKIAIWFPFGALQIREPSPIFQETDVFRLPSTTPSHPCRMPNHLLRSPWTEEKFQLLALLSNEAYIDEDGNFERSKSVLRTVIVERDLDTFRRLLALHVRVRVYSYPLRWPVRPNHFRVAARCAEAEREREGRDGGKEREDPFLRLLFEEYRDEIPVSDRSMRALLGRYGV